MSAPHWSDETTTLHLGDCLDVLPSIPDGSIAAIVTDPPYGLAELDAATTISAIAAWATGDRVFIPQGRGFMGREWDSFVPPPGAWDECMRVLKPGGHLLAFAGPRTVDLMTLSIRIAGFQVRDSISWLFGSGFPKSAGALKPAHEPVVVARKPCAGSMAANVLEHGTGALNIDGCRVPGGPRPAIENGIPLNPAVRYGGAVLEGTERGTLGTSRAAGMTDRGRWPSNVLLTHSAACDDHACCDGCPVAGLDAQSGMLTSGANPERRSSDKFRATYGDFAGQRECTPARGADSGGASRFFPVTRWDPERDLPFLYAAKASAAERPRLEDGTMHPTVKPVAVMRWLVRLVASGPVLDLFAGSGTTGEACALEGFPCVLIEKDPASAELIKVRMSRPIQPDLFGGAA